MKNKIFAFTFIFVLVFVSSAFAEIISGPGVAIVEVEGGKIQGYIRDGIFTYHGVPYAEAEIFMPPTKLKSWEGVKLAMNYGPMSPQDITPEVNNIQCSVLEILIILLCKLRRNIHYNIVENILNVFLGFSDRLNDIIEECRILRH